jgi:hypothetical protein
MKTLLRLLGFGIVASFTTLVLLATGVLPNTIISLVQRSRPTASPSVRLFPPAMQRPSTDQPGEVLGVAVTRQPDQQAIPADQFVTLSQLNQRLDEYTQFLGSFGVGDSAPSLQSSSESGAPVATGITGQVNNGNGQSTAVIGGSPVISYYPAAPASNFPGASLAGFTQLSAGSLSSGDASINGNLNVSGPVSLSSLISSGNVAVGGTLSAGTSTVSSLNVSGPANFIGAVTLPTSTVNQLLPLTNKGDLLTTNGITPVRFGVGSDGLCLIASSTAASGLAWQNCASASGALVSLNGQTQGTQSFATGTDPNLVLTISSQNGIHTFTPSWQGQLAVSRGGTGTSSLGSLIAGPGLSITGGQNVLIGTSTQINLGPNVITNVLAGSAGSSFNISTSTNSLTINLPIASAVTTGQLQASDWLTFNNKLSGNGSNGYLVRYTGTSTAATGILLDNGTVAGVNASSSTVSFNVQGSGSLNPFNIASSTGASLLTVLSNGNVGIGTSIPVSTFAINGSLTVSGISNLATTTISTLQLVAPLPLSSGGTGTTTAAGLQSALGLSYLTSSSQNNWYNYAAWGDSLTAGNEDGTGVTYPNVLQTLTGRPVYNGGVGGQTSSQIGVREGGVSTTASISGGQIPASGGVTVTLTTGYEPVTSQGPAGGTAGTISGVHGLVTLSGSTYTFTRSATGTPVSVTSAPFVVDTPYVGNFAIIWAGRNNSGSTTTVESDIANMVALLPSPKRFLVLGILNGNYGSTEWSGGAAYANITTINNYLAATYPNNYIDMREYLVSQYNPALPQDVIDDGHDVPPTSLRAIDGSGTLAQSVSATTTSFTITTANSLGVGNVALRRN